MARELPADLRSAALERLKFERSLGLEAVRPVPLPAPPSSPAPAPQSLPSAPAAAPASPPAPDPDLAQRWEALEAKALACTRCPLHRGRTHVVFGEGNRQARLVFVGEGPGHDEDVSGRPFVGRAGQLLNKIIGAMGLRREDVYICNTVKCRPPENRTPAPDEISACWPYLEEQLALIHPKVIVCLGSPAAKTLLRTTEGIMSLRGRWGLYKGIRVMPTYHPAFVLRAYTEENRGAVWSDMQQVMAYLKEETPGPPPAVPTDLLEEA